MQQPLHLSTNNRNGWSTELDHVHHFEHYQKLTNPILDKDEIDQPTMVTLPLTPHQPVD